MNLNVKYQNLKTDMRRVNYKSDIPPLLLSLKVDENQITVPDCDFIVRFYIEGYEGRHYDCSHIGGVWSNCEPSEDGTKLVCYINNQRLGIGELCAEFHYISPDRRYSDGSQKSVVIIGSTELGVELVEDNGDSVTEAAIDVTLPFIYRTAYEIARDHGYTGTAEDFYSALASVVGIAEAEAGRVSSEELREANEQQRVREFDAMKEIVDELEEKVDGVVEDEKSFEDAIRDQVNNYKPIVIEGNVTNAADEEDITSENGLLKLKDRSALNGMGYVILRQNKDFSEQVIKANTIYEIRYDFDLNGAEITIPENCVLKFNGGSLNNGSWKYTTIDHTIVKAKEVGFKEGSSNNISIHNGLLFQNLVHSGIGIDFENREYNLYINKTVLCNNLYLVNGTLNIESNVVSIFDFLERGNNGYISLNNIVFNNVTNNSIWLYRIEKNVNLYIDFILVNNCTFNNVCFCRLEFADFNPDIHKCGVANFVFKNSRIYNSSGSFAILENMYYENFVIQNNYIKNNSYSVFYFGINNDFVNFHNKKVGNLLFENNVHINDDDFLSASNITHGYICTLLTEGNNVIIRNNIFENIRSFNSVVYAFYASSENLECTNNIIKNVFNINQCTYPIIPLANDNSYNEIFKSKLSNSINYSFRKFYNNIVRIERENYIHAMKCSTEFPSDYSHYDEVQLTTKLFEPVNNMNVEFIGNNIDVEGVLLTNVSGYHLMNFKFINNKLSFYNIIPVSYENGIENREDVYNILGLVVFNKYSTTMVVKDNVFNLLNNNISPVLNLISAAYEDTQNKGSIDIEGNRGYNIYLSPFNIYYETKYLNNIQINVKDNKSICNNLQKLKSKYAFIDSIGHIHIENELLNTFFTFLSKDIDVSFTTKQLVNETSDGITYWFKVPSLAEGESVLIEYTKLNNDTDRIELYSNDGFLYCASDTAADLNRKIDKNLYRFFNNDRLYGGIFISDKTEQIEINTIIGTKEKNLLSNVSIKYNPYRLNLKLKKGKTNNRPVLETKNSGFIYYDIDINKYIVWNGTEWTNMDGTNLI